MGFVGEFTAANVRPTLVSACRQADLEDDGAELVRLGENAVFRLPRAGIVVRVGRSADREPVARKELAVARWLSEHGAPVAPPAAGIVQPLLVDQRVVTFWEEISSPQPSTPQQLGRALRLLHRLTPPPDVDLPLVLPLGKVRERIAAAATLACPERGFLQELTAKLERKFSVATYGLAPAVVHGDAHVDNLVRGADGRLAFVDLEEFAIGQPEWDLVLTAIERDCGWVSRQEYAEFADAYGYDVTTAPAYPLLRQTRLLRMTSWLSQKATESATVAAEVRRRISDLRTGAPIQGWRAF